MMGPKPAPPKVIPNLEQESKPQPSLFGAKLFGGMGGKQNSKDDDEAKNNNIKEEDQDSNKAEEKAGEGGGAMASKLAGMFGFQGANHQDQHLKDTDQLTNHPNKLIAAIARKINDSQDIKDLRERLKTQQKQQAKNNLFLMRLKFKIREKVQEVQTSKYGIADEKDTLKIIQEKLSDKFGGRKPTRDQIAQESQNMSVDLLKALQENYQKKKIMQKIGMAIKDKFSDQKEGMMLKGILDKEVYKTQALVRAQNNKFLFYCHKISSSHIFTNFILLCIVISSIILALDGTEYSKRTQDIFEIINLGFYFIFFFEMVIKLFGLGFKLYFREKYNQLDFLVVLITSVNTILWFINLKSGTDHQLNVFKALRAFRLIRLFKLAKKWRALNYMIMSLANAVLDLSTFCFLLFLFIFTYSILGMEWFAYLAIFNQNNEIDLDNGITITQNFNTFIEAFTTVFVILTSDNWCDIFYRHYRGVNSYLSSFFFLTLKIVGQYILLLLLLAILIGHFDEESMTKAAEGEEEQFSLYNWIKNKCKRSICCRGCSRRRVADVKTTFQQGGKKSTNESGKIKRFENFRDKLVQIVENKYFDYFIIFFIFASSIHLVLDRPLIDPNGEFASALLKVDLVLTIIFSLEAIVKMLAFGLITNGEKSYFRNSWNIMDFIIILSLAVTSINLKVFKIIRMLRVLRPLRVISKNEGLKISIKALFSAFSSIMNAILLSLFFFIIFGIISVNFFKGLFYHCYYDEISYLSSQDIIQMQKGEWSEDFQTKWDCINYGGEWLQYDSNFDSLPSSLSVLFTISQLFSWTTPMYQATNAVGEDMIQKLGGNKSIYYVLFFIFFAIVMNFLLTNLFVGIVVSAFNREKEKMGDNYLKTEQQKEWQMTKLLIVRAKPKLFLKEPKWRWRRPFYYISISPKFEMTIIVLIGLNSLILTLVWNSQTEQFQEGIKYLNYIFTILFNLEALIKILGLGLRYFSDSFNTYDFVIALGATVGLILENTFGNANSITNALRAFRIGRLFKLFRNHKSLDAIFEAFILSLPALINVGGLLLLFIFIYSVLTMNFFATLKWSGPMTHNLHFMNVFDSAVSLFVMQTGNNFYELYHSAAKQYSLQFECIYNPSYEDYANNGFEPIGCGDSIASAIIFYSFAIVVALIFMNLFIAIILQGYQETVNQNKKLFNSQRSQHFRDTWSLFDQDASGYIKKEDFKEFMFALGAPIGWDRKNYKGEEDGEVFIQKVSIPIENGKIKFTDMLEKLVILAVINEEIMRFLSQGKSEDNQSIMSENEKIFEAQKQKVESAFFKGRSMTSPDLGNQLPQKETFIEMTSIKEENTVTNMLGSNLKSSSSLINPNKRKTSTVKHDYDKLAQDSPTKIFYLNEDKNKDSESSEKDEEPENVKVQIIDEGHYQEEEKNREESESKSSEQYENEAQIQFAPRVGWNIQEGNGAEENFSEEGQRQEKSEIQPTP